MLVDVVLILHASRMTTITVTLFTIISTYSPPWRQKNREARSTALQPIRLITWRVVAGVTAHLIAVTDSSISFIHFHLFSSFIPSTFISTADVPPLPSLIPLFCSIYRHSFLSFVPFNFTHSSLLFHLPSLIPLFCSI